MNTTKDLHLPQHSILSQSCRSFVLFPKKPQKQWIRVYTISSNPISGNRLCAASILYASETAAKYLTHPSLRHQCSEENQSGQSSVISGCHQSTSFSRLRGSYARRSSNACINRAQTPKGGGSFYDIHCAEHKIKTTKWIKDKSIFPKRFHIDSLEPKKSNLPTKQHPQQPTQHRRPKPNHGLSPQHPRRLPHP